MRVKQVINFPTKDRIKIYRNLRDASLITHIA